MPEKESELIFLFGPPGSGKNYVGEIMESRYGFYFYDADDDHTPEQQLAKKEGRPFTFEMRVRFYESIRPKIETLLVPHHRLAVASFFAYDVFRRDYLNHFPTSQFILLETDYETMISRIKRRPPKEKKVPDELAILMINQFEPVTIPHLVIRNDDAQEEELLNQLDSILNR